MLERAYFDLAGVDELHVALRVLAEGHLLLGVVGEEVPDVLVVDLQEAEFEGGGGVILLQLLSFPEEVLGGEEAEPLVSLQLRVSEDREGLSRASNPVGEDSAVVSFSHSADALHHRVVENFSVAHLLAEDVAEHVLFHLLLAIFILLIVDGDRVGVYFDNFAGMRIAVLGEEGDGLRGELTPRVISFAL